MLCGSASAAHPSVALFIWRLLTGDWRLLIRLCCAVRPVCGRSVSLGRPDISSGSEHDKFTPSVDWAIHLAELRCVYAAGRNSSQHDCAGMDGRPLGTHGVGPPPHARQKDGRIGRGPNTGSATFPPAKLTKGQSNRIGIGSIPSSGLSMSGLRRDWSGSTPPANRALWPKRIGTGSGRFAGRSWKASTARA